MILKKVRKNSWAVLSSRWAPKANRKLCGSLCEILPTKQQTDMGETITSLVEVNIQRYSICGSLSKIPGPVTTFASSLLA